MSSSSFWQRLAHTFRIPIAAVAPPNGSVAGLGALEPEESGPAASELTNGGAGPEPRSLWKSRPGSVEQLRDAYQRVVVLMDAMQEHFARSDEKARHLGDSVERVAASVERLADAQTSQGRFIAAIAQHTESSARHGATLMELPASLQAQADALRSVAKHIGASQEQGAHLAQSLHSFGRAVDGLSASGARQTETLERLHESGTDQVAVLKDFLVKQGQRFTWLLGAVLGVSVAAIAGLAVLLVLLLSR